MPNLTHWGRPSNPGSARRICGRRADGQLAVARFHDALQVRAGQGRPVSIYPEPDTGFRAFTEGAWSGAGPVLGPHRGAVFVEHVHAGQLGQHRVHPAAYRISPRSTLISASSRSTRWLVEEAASDAEDLSTKWFLPRPIIGSESFDLQETLACLAILVTG